MISIRQITKSDLTRIIDERAKVTETLRTPLLLNDDHQLQWYEKEIANRESRTRYFIFETSSGVYDTIANRSILTPIGYGGVENIQWENRTAEISLLIYEEYRKKGYGKQAVDKILDHAFNVLNLETIWGECYLCGNPRFWVKMLDDCEYKTFNVLLPRRKFYNGKYYESIYFAFYRIPKE